MRTNIFGFLFCVASLGLAGCGHSGSGGLSDSPYPTENGSDFISVVDGLELNLAEQGGRLFIPGDAVVEDTPVSVAVLQGADLPDASRLVSAVYEFSPTNLSLSKAASLSLIVPATVNDSDSLYLAELIDGRWQGIASSMRLGDTVTASISRFGIYAVLRREPRIADKTIGPDCEAGGTEQSVRFIHVADLHSRFGYREQLYSRIKAAHLQALREEPYTVFTNGGDDFEKGTVAEQLSSGSATIAATKAMAFDVRVVGNHDYAWGPEQLLEYSQDDSAVVLASNTWYTGSSGEFAAVDFATVNVGCIKIGFFGMTSVPWNELDEPVESAPIPDFIADFSMNWSWQSVAQSIVGRYRGDVDYMVMLSHMGLGPDEDLAAKVSGVDLVLGGHTHGGESFETLDNGTMIVQPEFYGRGYTDLKLVFRLSDKVLTDVDYKTYASNDVLTADANTAASIDEIMGLYAPDAETEIAVSENFPDQRDIARIAAEAAMHVHGVNAALLDPAQVTALWLPGSLSQEDFINSYQVERQPSNTPGFNAMYAVSVSGAQLEQMAAEQTGWFAKLPSPLQATKIYKLVLQKGPALNLALFFPLTFNEQSNLSVSSLSETWYALDQYARYRTSQCLHIDTDKALIACSPKTQTTVWQFDDSDQPFAADFGPAQLSFFDPEANASSAAVTRFVSTTELGISDLPDGASGVLAFDDYRPDEGLVLRHNGLANGAFAELGLVSDYTVVMDLYWPAASDNQWRALLQTSLNNSDDADIFVEKAVAGGVGVATSGSGYFGSLPAESWHRVAFVFYAAPIEDGAGGTFKVFIDGELVGEKTAGDVGQRWALDEFALLFTDNSFETAPGYLNALLFSGRALSDNEIVVLGGASRKLVFSPDVRTLNQSVLRHYTSAPDVRSH
ncbi:metallophosphoesterase [Zhongshania sp. BJYM1]|uniref:metallophosphoesterase n=1 Tax=Zhongshania aquatica TaxID=2965069 RepID=UPI0022B56A26|nr:metallophosphoesterase [Marortus sp. BJYM1]